MTKNFSNNILAIDTTTKFCSVSLMKNNIIFNKKIMSCNKHTKYILKLIDELLLESNIKLKDINFLACSHGPGSLTGIRIGICIIQGISFVINTPTIGISTLMTIAQGAWRQNKYTHVIVTMHASIEKIYFAKYIRNKNGIWIGKNSEKIITMDQAKLYILNLHGTWVITGPACKIFSNITHKKKLYLKFKKNLLPHARDVIALTIQQLYKKNILNKKINPIYLLNIQKYETN
ncbi:MAG: N(6)-L-threonylcarbamoyladenine synthase, TsaB subunit [Candidatus Westeberhardia cardiocondylae]|nr:N(6)-L-threonylcarbamoyladenine synthase, TsaB subunit [Candidatus Westeberhardia cardiocondylae]